MIAESNRHERIRIMEAMLRVAAERGYAAASVEEVSDRAGLEMASFERLFADKEACFLAAYDSALDLLVAQVSSAWEAAVARPWAERVTAALRALLGLFAAEPDVARIAVVEVTALGEPARLRYRSGLGRFVAMVDDGRSVSRGAAELPPDTARFAIGAATSLIFAEIRGGRGAELERRLPELVFAVTVPYLGSAAAEAQMQRASAGR